MKKNHLGKRSHSHLPVYWLGLLILIFSILSLTPIIVGMLTSFLADSEPWKIRRHLPPWLRHIYPSLIFFLGSLSLSILISLILWFGILVPLGNISRAAKCVAKGDFSARVEPCRSLRELKELTDNFNRMVQELGSIESLRNDFVTTISHEFKTPLAAIGGYATLLQDPSLSHSQEKEYVRMIIDSTRQLSSMAGNILLLSRLEQQEIVTNQSSFKLDEQIRQAILMLEPLWEKKCLDLDIELPSFRYYSNAELLMQIWINLIQNAIKFTPPGGTLRVRMEVSALEVSVSVADTGIGMDEALQKRIFEKFYTHASDPALSGNGLGLSITKRIVELLHGSIRVESRPDEGSCFTVTLPAET